MRLYALTATVLGSMLLTACFHKGTNPADPYEPINREIYKFNMAFDATVLKPPAKLYNAVVPPPIRKGIDNVYDNVAMLPTVANDILQAEWQYTIKDTWRFLVNSTFGIAGIFDPASTISLPRHSNDLGITFAKWGDKNSPYIMIPFLGPSTIRDGMAMMYDYAFFTPYPYIPTDAAVFSVLALRYVDLRAQMLETDKLFAEAIDRYAFMRDAYLQHRNYLINGAQASSEDTGSLYVDDDDDSDTGANSTATPPPSVSEFPLTTSENDTHSPITARDTA